VYKIVISTTNRPIGVEHLCKMELEFIYVKYVSVNTCIISQTDTRCLLFLFFLFFVFFLFLFYCILQVTIYSI